MREPDKISFDPWNLVSQSGSVAMFFHYQRFFLAVILFSTSRIFAMDADVELWSRIVIKKAFISQETFAANRDTMSAPEFGFNSRQTGQLLKRGDLYDEFYYSSGEGENLELVFVESDVFQDDEIHLFLIEKGNGAKTLRFGNDEFIVERSSVSPNRASGNDGRIDGAVILKSDAARSDSVSFLDGDMTDYFSISGSANSILLIRESSRLKMDSEPAFPLIHSAPLLGRYLILETERAVEMLRITAEPGSGRTNYSLYVFAGENLKRRLTVQIFQDASARNSRFTYQEAATVLSEFSPGETKSYCRSLPNDSPITRRIACVYFLYPYGEDSDRKKIEDAYPSAPLNLKQAIDSVRIRHE